MAVHQRQAPCLSYRRWSLNYPVQNSRETEWFGSFEAALQNLPPEDRREIVREVREHLHERVRQGQAVDEVLSAFGAAGEYASGFLDEYTLTRARDSGRTFTMLSAVTGLARRSLTACMGLLFACLFSLLIMSSLTCLTIKVIHPDRVGLWVDRPFNAPRRYIHSGPERLPLRLGRDHIQFGYANPVPRSEEVLGLWMYPSLLVLALLGFLGLRLTLSRTVKTLLRRRA